MNDLTRTDQPETAVWRPSAAINPQRLDYLWTLAERMARSTIVPESLRTIKQNGQLVALDHDEIVANVFAVVEQADRWNMSPWALLSCAAIVHRKLGFEGKVIAAVLESNYGIALHPYYTGERGTDSHRIYLCDQPLSDEQVAALKPGEYPNGYKIVDGSVAEWKTTGNGSPWKPSTYGKQLVYRGTREWARLHKASAILGVLADDEIQQFALEHAAQNAVPLAQRFAVPSGQGFSPDNVAKALEHQPQVPMEIMDETTGEFHRVADVATTTVSGAQSGGDALKTTPEPKADKASASAQPAQPVGDNGAGSTAAGGSRPQQTPPDQSSSQSAGHGGDAPPPPARVSADLWRGYHSALGRAAKPDSLKKAHDEYWKDKGIKITHEDDIKLGADIKQAHVERVDGKLEAGYVAKEIDGWIQQVTGEPL